LYDIYRNDMQTTSGNIVNSYSITSTSTNNYSIVSVGGTAQFLNAEGGWVHIGGSVIDESYFILDKSIREELLKPIFTVRIQDEELYDIQYYNNQNDEEWFDLPEDYFDEPDMFSFLDLAIPRLHEFYNHLITHSIAPNMLVCYKINDSFEFITVDEMTTKLRKVYDPISTNTSTPGTSGD
jgi:hypothetical protein